MNNPFIRNRRAIFLYSLALILPGVILSIMAYRGVQGNMAMAEKIQSRRLALAKVGNDFFEHIDESISKQIALYSNEEFNDSIGYFRFSNPKKATEFHNNENFVSLLSWNPENPISLLINSMLFVPDDHWNRQAKKEPTLYEFSMSLESEFSDRNYTNALLINQRLGDLKSDKLFNIQALMSEARIHRRLGHYKELKANYRDLYELTKDPEILPFIMPQSRHIMSSILTAWFRNNEFVSDTKDPSLIEMEIAAFLSIPQCLLTQSSYSSCQNEYKQFIQATKNESLKSLFQIHNHLVHKNNVMLRMVDQIERSIIQESENNTIKENLGFPYYEDSVSLYTIISSTNDGKILAMIVDMHEYLISELNASKKLDEIPNSVIWRILDERENVLIAHPDFDDSRIEYSESPIHLGLWSLQLQNTQSPTFLETLTSNEGIYFVGFVFVIIGMLVGLIITLRGLAKENKLMRLKSDFISSVSHELKTPVTSIRQMSEMLVRDRIKDDGRKKEYYSTMMAQSERLSHLVENILDFSRLEYGIRKLRIEQTNIEELILNTIEIFEIRLRYTGYTINANFQKEIPILFLDQEGIRQVVYNLLDNAYKYSGKSKEIDVRVLKSNKEIEINVRDYGIGIQVKDQKRIFDRFYRSKENQVDGIKGTGIGLAIVSQVVNAHGGRIEVKSQPGIGSTFKVFLPLKKSNLYEKDLNS